MRSRSLALGLAALVLALPAAAAVVGESEPNARGTPDVVPATGLAPFASVYPNGSVLVTGALGAGDADFYALELSAGQLLMIGAFDAEGGELTDTRIGVFFEAPSASDPGDAPEAENDDGGPGFLSRLAVPIEQSGTWKIGVTGFRDTAYTGDHLEARSGPVAYRLAIAVTTATPPRSETEPANDAPASGDLLPPGGGVLRGALAPGDVDWARVELAAGEDVTVSLFDLRPGPVSPAGELTDTRLRLLDAGGQPLAEDDDGGPGFLSNLFRTPGLGQHRIGVTGFRDVAFDGAHLTGPADYALVVAATGRCDVDGGGFVDQADVNAILAARGQPASGPADPRDNDGSGVIDVGDSRACALQCGKPRCQPQAVAGCGLLGPELLLPLLPVWLARRRLRKRSAARLALLGLVLAAPLLPRSAAAVSLAVTPPEQTVSLGASFSVTLEASALGDDAIGGFDVDLGFDATRFTFVSALFGGALGDTGAGDQLTDTVPGAGSVSLGSVSVLTPAELDALQTGGVALVTLTFQATAVGSDAFTIDFAQLFDAFGAELPAGGLANATVNVVPEPRLAWLLALGAAAAHARRRRRQRVDPVRQASEARME